MVELNTALLSLKTGSGTTPSVSQGTTPIVILQSAQAKGLPAWILPGIVTALKSVYKTLDSATQTQIQTFVNDPNVSIDSLTKKLGKITDGLSQSQRTEVRDLLTQAEMDRRTAGTSLQDNKTLTDEEKEVLSGLIETVIDTTLSLVKQCTQIQQVVGSSSADTLATLGVPSSLPTVDCTKLGSVLFS
jgi:hypothetical protein